MTTLAIYSNKGGVGKTAAAVNLSYLAAQTGAKTLLCDLDPQGSATYYFRVKPKLRSGAKGFVKGGKQVYKSVKGTDYENLDLLPADFSLRNLDVTFSILKRSKKRLKKILNPFRVEYDLIILDCPVYRQLLAFCQKNKYAVNRIYSFFSMVDRHKKMHKELMATVAGEFNGVLQSFIPYLAVIEKMGLYREPVAVFSPKSVASKSYQNLWHKVQKNILSSG
jgi:cellulose biosynthesis protein BcsQ